MSSRFNTARRPLRVILRCLRRLLLVTILTVPRIVRVGARVRHWRSRAGISQGALAAAVGVSRPAVTHWESGRKNPLQSNLERIAKVCGVSLEEFWGPLKMSA